LSVLRAAVRSPRRRLRRDREPALAHLKRPFRDSTFAIDMDPLSLLVWFAQPLPKPSHW
jgi:hypothetical protein